MRCHFTFILVALLSVGRTPLAADLHLNNLDYFESQGLSVLAYQNLFHDVFRDQKLGGIEIIQHGERIATDGEVRLLPTPEQWDAVPKFTGRKRGAVPDQLIALSGYPDLDLAYRIEVTAEGEGFRIAVHLDKPLPEALVGKQASIWTFCPPPISARVTCWMSGQQPPRSAYFHAIQTARCSGKSAASTTLAPPKPNHYPLRAAARSSWHRKTQPPASASPQTAAPSCSSTPATGRRTAGSSYGP